MRLFVRALLAGNLSEDLYMIANGNSGDPKANDISLRGHGQVLPWSVYS